KLSGSAEGLEEVAQMEMKFSTASVSAHLSWRAPERRTSATIVGQKGTLEVLGDRLILTAGKPREIPVDDIPDDSYHSTWFAGVAAEFTTAMRQGASSEIAQSNLNEARVAVALIASARKSSLAGGAETPIPLDF